MLRTIAIAAFVALLASPALARDAGPVAGQRTIEQPDDLLNYGDGPPLQLTAASNCQGRESGTPGHFMEGFLSVGQEFPGRGAFKLVLITSNDPEQRTPFVQMDEPNIRPEEMRDLLNYAIEETPVSLSWTSIDPRGTIENPRILIFRNVDTPVLCYEPDTAHQVHGVAEHDPWLRR